MSSPEVFCPSLLSSFRFSLPYCPLILMSCASSADTHELDLHDLFLPCIQFTPLPVLINTVKSDNRVPETQSFHKTLLV